MKLEPMQPLPPNCNPFRFDYFSMGSQLGSNVTIMYEKHHDQKQEYLIIVNTETGERQKLIL